MQEKKLTDRRGESFWKLRIRTQPQVRERIEIGQERGGKHSKVAATSSGYWARTLHSLFYLILIKPYEWPKSKTLTPPNDDKDVEHQKSLFFASRNVKWYSHVRRQFGSFIQSSTQAYHSFLQFRYLLKGVENFCSHKNLNCIHKWQKLKAIQHMHG